MTERGCGRCGARLADDQRYCLNCGRRRGESRVDFRRHLSAVPEPRAADPPPPATPAVEAGSSQRDFTPLAAAGGIAVLGLMLLVGVLIGRGDGGQAVAPAPQVVRVQADGEEEATNDDEGGGALGAATGKAGPKGSGKGKARAAAGKAPPPEIVASESELEALQEQSPQEYSESSAKLPDEIATPGKAPPTDGKAPGGGSKGTAIE